MTMPSAMPRLKAPITPRLFDFRATPWPNLAPPLTAVVEIAGKALLLWRAVDQHGVFLVKIHQSRPDKRAAKRLLRKLMKRAGSVPKWIITDKLRSYGAAKREVAPDPEHWPH